MPIELVIWDYNGTLTDDLSRIAKAVNLFIGEFGIAPASDEDVACYEGDIGRFYRKRNINLPKAEIRKKVFDIYSKLNDPLNLRPHAIEALESINKPQILVTKHPIALTEREIDQLKIRKYFCQVFGVTGDKVSLFKQVCGDRNICASEGVVIGDMIYDIDDGKLAGNKTIGIQGYHPRHILEQHKPDRVVDSLLEIYDSIQSLNKLLKE